MKCNRLLSSKLLFLSLLGLTTCLDINLVPNKGPVTLHSLNGAKNTPVDYVVNAPPDAKVASQCRLYVKDCSLVRLDVDTGIGQSYHCDPNRASKFLNSSHQQTLVLTMRHSEGFQQRGIECQVWATRPFLSQPMEDIDSSEYGTVAGRVETTCECGKSNKEDGSRIVGGVETTPNEFPFLAAIYMENFDKPYCGGSIITPYHILTATHCVPLDLDEDDIQVKVGEHDIENDSGRERVYDVEEIIRHSEYSKRRFLNDIAILRLTERIEFNQFVSRICLPSAPPVVGHHVRYMGWGMTSYGGNTSAINHKVDVKLIDPAVCDVVFNVESNENRQICTYSTAKDSCKGDSGGPLVWLDPDTNRYTQVGIVSFGRVCATTDPAVTTNVYNYLHWIKENTQGDDSQTCSKVVS